MPYRAEQIYGALLFAGILSTGLLFAALSPGLPYGGAAREVLIACVLLSLAPAAYAVRAHFLGRHLVEGELLRMAPSELPSKVAHTFLGLAFPWSPTHAERLMRMMSEGWEPPERTQALFGGNTLIHGLGVADETPLFIPDKKRTHHTLVLGSPGEGKTRFLELMIRQLVAKGDVLVIVDPKGDARLINAVRQACEETGRSGDFRLVALPWPKTSVAYNPLANFGTPSEIADRLIGMLPPAGGDSEAFRGFQWGATCAVVQALFLAGKPITIHRVLHGLRSLSDVAIDLVRKRFPELFGKRATQDIAEIANAYEAAVVAGTMKRSEELDDLLHYLQLDTNYYRKMVASFLPQLERLSAGPKREVLSPEPEETAREILTWTSVDRQRLVVYFYLGSLHGEESANAVGRMLLLDLQAYLAARYSYDSEGRNRRLSLFVDEAHHLVSKPFLNILAEARGADVAVVLSSQTTAQFEQSLGSKAAVDEILTHSLLHVQFQSRNPREAEDFSKLAGERQLRVAGESYRYEPAFFSSGLSNVDDFRAMHNVSIQLKDAPLVPPWAICQLPTFHYFARLGGRLYKGRIPLLTDPTSTFVQDLQKESAA